MKKKRGLRRYYRNLSRFSGFEWIDFSGCENSWFDFYHIHADNTGLGNKSWKSRKQHLEALFVITEELEQKLKNYPNPFQYWIRVAEFDTEQDAIFIHTPNPNNSHFPEKLIFNNNLKASNQQLETYLSTKDYSIDKMELRDENGKPEIFFFLQKTNFGLKLS